MERSGHDGTTTTGCTEQLRWRTAQLCSGGNCAEVAVTDAHVYVRDSKTAGSPPLSFTHDEWRTFVGAVRAGEFDLP